VVEPGNPFISNWHIDAICEHLEAVGRSEIRRLLINIPPRCMKSLTVSVMWPTWAWATKPDMRFVFAAYAQRLSTRDSLKCRRIIASPWYQRNWADRFQITSDQNEKMRFENDRTGFRISTTVGTGTGDGGDIVAVDDPHDVTQSLSPVQREQALIWWDETMPTRLNNPKRGGMVIVMQRLHEQDLAGHVLAQGGYEHLMLPMEYEPDRKCFTCIGFQDPRQKQGELLWPERVGETEVRELHTRLGSYGAAGQLQQRPAPRGGGMFQRQWFKIVDQPPWKPERKVRYWDMAASEARQGADPDWTVGTLMSVKEGDLFIEDVRRARLAPKGVKDLIGQTAQLDGKGVPIWIEQEPGSSGKTVVDDLCRTVLQGFAARPDRPTGKKENRADPLAAAAEAGRIKLVSGPWVEDWLRELEVFPAGAHDDQVDSASGAYAQLTAVKKGGTWGRKK
jgi:predicted phage terminase large subunit-like protein